MNDSQRKRKSKSTLQATAVDIFCGAGGLTRGLRNAGISVAVGFDVDEECQFPYEKNNHPAIFKQCDVKNVTAEELISYYPEGHRRILVGCAPCQTFSKYTQGLENADDPKWQLLDEFARLVKEVKPDVVSMENVPELQRHAIFDRFLEMLSADGYFFNNEKEKRIVYCPDYGIPQHRSRLVLLASRLGPIELLPPTHTPENYRTVNDALKDLPPLAAGEECAIDLLHRSSRLSTLNLKRIKKSKAGGTWRDWPEELVANCHKKKKGETYPSVYGRMDWEKPSPTITTQYFGYGNGRFGHPEQDRAISLREGAILQSFPANYKFVKPGQSCCFATIGRMVGNAVPVRLGEVVGLTICKHLKKYSIEES